MAFGKDEKNLGQIASFRGQARAHQAARPRPTGHGGAAFRDRYQPSTDDPDEIRVLKGHYEVPIGHQDGSITTQTLYYFPYIEHFHATMKKGGQCSAGPLGMFKGKGEPCMGCEIFWADRNAGKKNGPMSRRELWGFTIVHFAPYAKVPQVDRTTGQPKTNDQGQPYMEWVRVQPHQRQQFAQYEMRDFHVMHWSIGFGHSQVLMDMDEEIGRSCSTCGGRDTIKCEAWCCPNPQCQEPLIDPATTTLSPKEVKEFTSKIVRCASCMQEGMLQEIISCTQCGNAKRAEIFDVNLRVKRSVPADGGNQTKLLITGWSNPGPIDPRYHEFAKPLALDKIFAPTPYEKQQEMWSNAGTRAPVTSNQLHRPYGGGSGAPTLGGTGTPGNGPKY